MRIANVAGRAVIVLDHGLIDVHESSKGRFPSQSAPLLARLAELHDWLERDQPATTSSLGPHEVAQLTELDPVVDAPSQVFAVGLNYRTHAAEMGLTPPSQPMIFAKFASSLAGARATFALPSAHVDWEAELVVVIGRGGRNIAPADALDAVAGYCVGQDLSDRDLQMVGSPPQFSLGKSHRNFAPVGPWITTVDEVGDPQDLRIQCTVNGTMYQDSSTQDMVFSVREIIAYLSRVCELRPGDLIFTGTPNGVGQGLHPPVFLHSGDEVVTTIGGLGTLRNRAE